MRYLKSREDFLIRQPSIENINVPEQIKSSEMISEAFENDIRFGDSLVGRLLNSAVRIIKIGVKSNVQVPRLLERLETELDNLVTEAFNRDLAEKFDMYSIKFAMETIKNICLSTETKEQKLEKLIGWNGQDPMWNGDDPTGPSIFGYDSNSGRFTEECQLQTIIDRITNDLPDLQDFWGTKRNDLLDKLSDFGDELRKSTVETNQIGGNTSTVQQFAGTFGNALNSLVTAGFHFNSSYQMFLEANEKETSLSQLKSIAPQLSKEIKDKKRDEIVELDIYKKFTSIFKNLSKDEIERLKKQTPEGSDKNLYQTLYELIFGEKKETTSDSFYNTLEILKSLSAINKILLKQKQNPTKPEVATKPMTTKPTTPNANVTKSTTPIKPKGGETADNTQTQKTNASFNYDSDYYEMVMEAQWSNQSKIVWKKILQEWNNLNVSSYIVKINELIKNSNSDAGKSNITKIGDNIKKFDKINKRKKFQDLIKENDNTEKRYLYQIIIQLSRVIMGLKGQALLNSFGLYTKPLSTFVSNYDSLVGKNVINDSFEFDINYQYSIIEGGTNTPATGGTGGSGGGGNPPPATRTVKEIWEEFWKEWDEKESHRLTQREIAEFDEMVASGGNLTPINPRTRPDGLLAITRTFKSAHNAYFTESIPSGRKGGMVSNQTLRQYIYIGSGGRPRAESAGDYGPWLVKSLWEKWTDGVMRILQNQQLREVLSKIDFTVAGAEDSFNKNRRNESLINEEVGEDRLNVGLQGQKIDTKDKKPHGQILLDFINDMLDQDRQADFDGARRSLLKQYFGISEKSKKEDSNKSSRTTDKEDKKRLFFKKLEKKASFDVSDEKKFFCIPCKSHRRNKPGEKVIFCHVIKVEGDKVHIKFTLDYPSFAKKIKDTDFNGYNFDIESVKKQDNDVRFIYIGVMNNDFANKQIKLVYQDITPNAGSANLLGEPESQMSYNFQLRDDIDSKNSDERIPFAVLSSQTGETVRSVEKDNVIIKGEPNNTNLRTTFDGLSPTPIEQGRTWRFWN